MTFCDEYVADNRKIFLQSCREYGTLQYILDEHVLMQNCNEILSAFRDRYPNTRLYYPYKTNGIPYILQLIHKHGIGAEVSSLIELKLADRFGVSNVVFNSPGKTLEELTYAIERYVTIIIDNLDELDKIKSAFETTRHKPILGVRLNLDRVRTGEWSRFGVSSKKLPELLKELNKMDLTLRGLHFHLGSRFKNAGPYESALSELGKLLGNGLFKDVRDTLRFIDIGGGIGVNGSVPKDFLDYAIGFMEKFLGYGRLSALRNYSYANVDPIQSFADRICTSFKREIIPVLGDVELWIEPGRWLVNTCIHMLSTVLAVKEDSIVIDGGVNILPNALNENYPVVNLSKYSETKKKTSVYGPLCMSNDKISSQLFGEKPNKGNILCVMNVGAYNISWSQQFIKPLARVVSMSKHGLKEVRQEEDFNYRMGRDIKL